MVTGGSELTAQCGQRERVVLRSCREQISSSSSQQGTRLVRFKSGDNEAIADRIAA